MQNAVGPFYNLDFYFQKLAMLLERYFDKSSIPSKLINIRTNNKGEIVGWDIDRTKLKFNDCNCSLYVREKAIVDYEMWSLMFFLTIINLLKRKHTCPSGLIWTLFHCMVTPMNVLVK
jgi:hypothetical protein